MLSDIETGLANLQQIGCERRYPSGHGPQASQKLFQREGLGQIIICTGIQPCDLVIYL